MHLTDIYLQILAVQAMVAVEGIQESSHLIDGREAKNVPREQ